MRSQPLRCDYRWPERQDDGGRRSARLRRRHEGQWAQAPRLGGYGRQDRRHGFDFLTAARHQQANAIIIQGLGAIGVADDCGESLEIVRKTRLAGLPGRIYINDPLSLNESPIYQIHAHSESHQISLFNRIQLYFEA
jgi:hypothetical protein